MSRGSIPPLLLVLPMKRWLILLLGMIANLAQGVAYASSVIGKPMMENMLGITGETAIKSHFAVIFTMSCILLPVGMLLAGRLEKFSPRLPIALGAIIYGLGVFASGFVTNFYVLCITFGLMLSLGSGLAYGPIVASAVRWFPDKKGLASGLVVGALGFGPVWIAPLCASLLGEQFTIQQVLQILGVICVTAIGAAVLIPAAPQQKDAAAPDAKNRNENKNAGNLSGDMTWMPMICTGRFWLLFALLFLGAVPGIMVISGASGIFQTVGGFTPDRAAGLVAVLAIANALGRFFWGTVSDYIGRINTLTVMFVLSAVSMLTLTFSVVSFPAVLIAVIFVIGTAYGGYLGLFPSFCAESFGLKNMATNYALLFIAFSTATLVGPRIYGSFEPQQAFYIASALAASGIVVSLLERKRERLT